jgi:hypothetical protein
MTDCGGGPRRRRRDAGSGQGRAAAPEVRAGGEAGKQLRRCRNPAETPGRRTRVRHRSTRRRHFRRSGVSHRRGSVDSSSGSGSGGRGATGPRGGIRAAPPLRGGGCRLDTGGCKDGDRLSPEAWTEGNATEPSAVSKSKTRVQGEAGRRLTPQRRQR